MRAVIDNNVILDAAASRSPHNQAAERIILLAGEDRFEGYITANSATDIYYVMKKMAEPTAAKELISHLFNLFDVVPVTGEDCGEALSLPMDDFEDALLAVCAEKIEADFIITRDEAFLRAVSPVPVVSPSDFLIKLDA